jgi:hypothetical protein
MIRLKMSRHLPCSAPLRRRCPTSGQSTCVNRRSHLNSHNDQGFQQPHRPLHWWRQHLPPPCLTRCARILKARLHPRLHGTECLLRIAVLLPLQQRPPLITRLCLVRLHPGPRSLAATTGTHRRLRSVLRSSPNSHERLRSLRLPGVDMRECSTKISWPSIEQPGRENVPCPLRRDANHDKQPDGADFRWI